MSVPFNNPYNNISPINFTSNSIPVPKGKAFCQLVQSTKLSGSLRCPLVVRGNLGSSRFPSGAPAIWASEFEGEARGRGKGQKDFFLRGFSTFPSDEEEEHFPT